MGDSITDAGRSPEGESSPWLPSYGLGNGFVTLVHSWLQAIHPEAGIRVVNRGISGNTVRDLARRWSSDVLAQPPQTLAIMIGINDVWRQFDTPHRPDLAVPSGEYRTTLADLVRQAKVSVPRVILATPFFIEPSRSDPMRASMDTYGNIVREIAREEHTDFIDLQAAFDRVLAHLHPMNLAWDRVHPSPAGHMIIAQEFLHAFGLQTG